MMEDNFKPVVQPQRRLNLKVQDVVKAEIVKLLDVGLIYAISDSPWVIPIYVVPKKRGMTVIANENNELIPTRIIIGWKVCIDYRKLNESTRKDHFLLPFIDQMLERLSGNERMPFGLCNAPATFQRCMTAIFHDMYKDFMEVFMDDFFVFDKLTMAPVIIAHDWNLDFELMHDARDYAVGAVLGKRTDKKFHPIYYASKTMNDAQEHYTTTEKDLLAVVYAFDKFLHPSLRQRR
ncbi:reverse transcriptase domain-containing protein [Tanacetum coccineum]